MAEGVPGKIVGCAEGEFVKLLFVVLNGEFVELVVKFVVWLVVVESVVELVELEFAVAFIGDVKYTSCLFTTAFICVRS